MSTSGNSSLQLQKAAGYVQDTASYIEGLRVRVQEIKAGLKWQGGAYQRFSQALDGWDVEFRGLRKDLETIYDRLNINAGVYKNASDQNMEVVASFRNMGEAGGRIDSLINTNKPA